MHIGTKRFFFNADSSAEGGESDDSTSKDGGADAKNEPTIAELQAQIKELIDERQAAKTRARKAEDELSDLRKKHKGKERESAEQSGDIEKVRASFQERETELSSTIDGLKSQLKERDKRAAFDRNAHLFADELRDDVWELVKGKLDVIEEGGMFKVVTIDDHRSPDEFLKGFAAKRPHYAKNPGKSGTSADGVKQKGGKATTIPADLRSWPKDKQSEWMKDNPELAAEAAAKALGV